MLLLRYLIFVSLLTGITHAQQSNEAIISHMISAMIDSLNKEFRLDQTRLNVRVPGDDQESKYLRRILKHTYTKDDITTRNDSILVYIYKPTLELKYIHDDPSATGNRYYRRQLNIEMEVILEHSISQRELARKQWKASFEDKVDMHMFRKLNREYFPVKTTGNFRRDNPSSLHLILLSLLTLGGVAMLYFIRT